MQIKDNKANKSSLGKRTEEDQLIVDLFSLLLEWHIEDKKQKDIKNDRSGTK